MAVLTIHEQEDQLRCLLQTYVRKTVHRTETGFDSLLNILTAQKQWSKKLHSVQAFRVTLSSLNKALSLQVKVDRCSRWLRVSWRKGSSVPRKETNHLQSAFRQAVYHQISIWKKTHHAQAECVQCKDVHKVHLKLHADHHEPSFNVLTRIFLSRPVNTIIPQVFGHSRKCGRIFTKMDFKFKRRWQVFHRQHAVLQWLCRRCNLGKRKK